MSVYNRKEKLKENKSKKTLEHIGIPMVTEYLCLVSKGSGRRRTKFEKNTQDINLRHVE